MSGKDIIKFLIDHPLPLFVTVSVIAAIFLHVIGAEKWRRISAGRMVSAGMAVALLAGAAVLVLMGVYCTNWFFLDHAEPSITCLSWLFVTGQTVYHGIHAPQRYSLLYGPALFVAYGWPMKLIAPSVPLVKATACVYVLGAVALTWLAVNKFGRRAALAGLVYLLIGWSCFGDLMVWVRADAPLIFIVALALAGVSRAKPVLGCIICGTAVGLAVNIKAHAVLYFIPMFIIILQTSGISLVLLGALAATVVAAAPFFFMTHTALINYLTWLREVSRHTPQMYNFVFNLEFLLYFSTPLLALWLLSRAGMNRLHGKGAMLVSLLISALVVCVLAAKGGAGPWHLLPFLPSAAYVLAGGIGEAATIKSSRIQARRTGELIACGSIIVGFVVAGLFMLLTKDAIAVHRIRAYASLETTSELHAILAENRGKTIGMAPGDDGDYQAVWFRTIPVLAGQPLLIDPVACMDDAYARLELSPAVVSAVGGGVYDVWIVPKNARPFTMHSYYGMKEPLFPLEIQQAFDQAYYRDPTSEQFELFDVWVRRT